MKKPKTRAKSPAWNSLSPQERQKLADSHNQAADLLGQSSLSDPNNLAFQNRQLAGLVAGEKFPAVSIPSQVKQDEADQAVAQAAVVAPGQAAPSA